MSETKPLTPSASSPSAPTDRKSLTNPLPLVLAAGSLFVAAALLSDGLGLAVLALGGEQRNEFARLNTEVTLRVLLATAACATVASFAMYALMFAIFGLVNRLGRPLGKRRLMVAGCLLAALPASWAAFELTRLTLSGHRISQRSVSDTLRIVAPLVAWIIMAWCFSIAARKANGREPARRWWVLWIAGAFVVAVLVVDGLYYRGRYPPAHTLLWLAAGAGVLTVAACLRRPGRSTALGLAMIALMVVGAALLIKPLRTSQSARVVASYHTQFLSLAFRHITPREAEGPLPDAALLAQLMKPGAMGKAVGRALSEARKRPTVIVSVDALRFDRIGILTPAIGRFADQGVAFNNAWTPYPITLGAFTGAFRGVYPHPDLIDRPGSFDDPVPALPSIAELAARAGWKTHAVTGFATYNRRPFTPIWRGFEEVEILGAPTRHAPAKIVVRRALEVLSTRASERLLLWVHCFDPHEPGRGAGAIETRYDAVVGRTDAALAPLFERLQEIEANVIFMADHGKLLTSRALEPVVMVEELLPIPLILRVPGIPAGTVNGPVDLVSITPTLIDILGLERPDHLQAPSLFARLVDQDSVRPFTAFAGFSEASVAVKFEAVRNRHGMLLDDKWANSRAFGRVTDHRWEDRSLEASQQESLIQLARAHRALTDRGLRAAR